MGNQPSNAISAPRPSTTLDSYVEELGKEVAYDKSIGTARLLKTIKARHAHGPLLIKIFVKPDLSMNLVHYRRRLKDESDRLSDVPNVYSYQTIVETEKAAYLVRQYLASDLFDRISTRPFLTPIEKRWFTFQILKGMADIQSRKISHGDLKPSNVLVTTGNWIYITDLSPFKPVYIPEDDPADFSFFFDTTSRRSCYLAPERFYGPGSKPESRRPESSWETGGRDNKVTEKMDVFSAGCTIAELWLEGKDVFNLSGMLSWKKGESSPEAVIAEIEEPAIRDLVREMLSLEPDARPTFDTILATYRGSIFPEFFYLFFHDYNVSLNEIQNAAQLFRMSPSSDYEDGGVPPYGIAGPEVFPGESDERIERLTNDLESIKAYLDAEEGAKEDEKGNKDVAKDGPAILILALITSNIRNCYRPSSKMRSLDAMLELSHYFSDETRLDRIVPFMVTLLRDEVPVVRAAAVRSLAVVLETVETVALSNTAVVTEYVLPNAWHLAQDEDVSVRVAYASSISTLAEVGMRFLELSESLRLELGHRGSTGEAHDITSAEEPSYEEHKQELHRIIQSEVTSLLYDSSPLVKRAALAHITTFCIFFGRAKTNEVLLSHVFTYLNDSDWHLRHAFFESIVGVAAFVGSSSLEAFILPLMTQALSDPEEAVSARVLGSLRSLAELDLFSGSRLWELLDSTLGLLVHPDVWIRQGAAGFIASASRRLSKADLWCLLYPKLRRLLETEIEVISDSSILSALSPPLSRTMFDAFVAWAARAEPSSFWSARPPLQKAGSSFHSKNGRETAIPWSEEDRAILGRYPTTDQSKLLMLKPHILRLSQSIKSTRRPAQDQDDVDRRFPEPTLQELSLMRLSVTPQTVFINPRPSDAQQFRRTKSRTGSRAVGEDPSAQLQHLRRHLSSKQSTYTPSAPPSIASSAPHTAPQSSPMPVIRPTPSHLHEVARSPSDSILSHGSPLSRLRSPISTAFQSNVKSTPSVSAVDTNAVGHLESTASMRDGDDEVEPQSGRSTPVPRPSVVKQHSTVTGIIPLTEGPVETVVGYDFGDPSIRALLESVYLESFRDPLIEFGPRISSGRRKSALRSISSGPSRSAGSTSTPIVPETTLISHLSGHSTPVAHILVSADNLFFITASSDGHLQVWDTSRLERSITSKPRLKHHIGAELSSLCMLEGLHCFAVGGMDGTLTVIRVHVHVGSSAPKYRDLQIVRFLQLERQGDRIKAMSHFANDLSNELICITEASLIVVDLYSMLVTETIDFPLHLGSPVTLALGEQRIWAVVGTSSGWLTLWDLRFGVLLRSWKVDTAAAPSHDPMGTMLCVRHPLQKTWVIVAGGSSSPETHLQSFNIETGELMESYKVVSLSSPTSQPLESPLNAINVSSASTEEPPDPAKAIADLISTFEVSRAESNHTTPGVTFAAVSEASPESSSEIEPRVRISCVALTLAVSGFNHTEIFTGGHKRMIRRLDLTEFSKSSFVACTLGGADVKRRVEPGPPPTYTEVHASTQRRARTVRATESSVTALAFVISPTSAVSYIIGGESSGRLKVWRL